MPRFSLPPCVAFSTPAFSHPLHFRWCHIFHSQVFSLPHNIYLVFLLCHFVRTKKHEINWRRSPVVRYVSVDGHTVRPLLRFYMKKHYFWCENIRYLGIYKTRLNRIALCLVKQSVPTIVHLALFMEKWAVLCLSL